MHIPDGFLSTPIWAGLNITAVPIVGYFVRRTQAHFDTSRVPLLGVLGSFVFAAQMINFPVWGGTSGHLIGGALLAFTVGPNAATVVMTAILAVQALIFQDGGLLALGANVINMAVVGVWVGYLPMKWLGHRGGRARSVAAFAGGWLSLMAAATLAAVELSLSRLAPSGPLFSAILGIHALTGIAEGLITAASLAAIERLDPSFAQPSEAR
jgi:cobalt/nickel transport system permease protein